MGHSFGQELCSTVSFVRGRFLAIIRATILGGALVLTLCATATAKKKPEVVRWDENTGGCTLTTSDDGKYRWGLSSGDLNLMLSIDSQELQLSRKRLQHTLAVQLSLRYSGADKLEFDPQQVTVEYLNHHRESMNALKPDAYVGSLQNGADDLEYEYMRELKKHPEKKDEQKEAALREYLQEVSDLQTFVGSHSLRATTLDAEHKQVAGWLYFGTHGQWIGQTKNAERLVFRIPLGNKTVEFPITMPPNDVLTLRKR